MKTRTFRVLAVLLVTTASMAVMASIASAQVVITDSGNGTGNSINAGGGFGPTEIRNSGNGDYNTINVERSYGHTFVPQQHRQVYTVQHQTFPTYTTWTRSYPTATRYHAEPTVRYRYSAPAPRAQHMLGGRYSMLQPHPVGHQMGGTEIRDSGNGTGNTIRAAGGFGASVIGSGNGDNNTINIGQ